MQNRLIALGLCLICAMISMACDQEMPIVAVKIPDSTTLSKIVHAPPLPPAADANSDENRKKRRKFNVAPVYVDGECRGFLNYPELPNDVQPHFEERDEGKLVKRFYFADYLKSLGISIPSVKEVLFHGGKVRRARVSGADLMKSQETLKFAFTRPFGGKSRLHLPPDGSIDTRGIDIIDAVSVFIEKQPPIYDEGRRVYRTPDGKETTGIPYVAEESYVRGTRVYLDGRYLTSIKRKTLPDSMLAPDATDLEPTFLLQAFLNSVEIAPEQVETIDFIQKANMVARLNAEEWNSVAAPLAFALPRHNQSKIRLNFPTDAKMSAKRSEDAQGSHLGPMKVDAILVFSKEKPPERDIELSVESVDTGSSGSPPSGDFDEE